jgi:glycosyltransferase involved in cell wall biosynthesis
LSGGTGGDASVVVSTYDEARWADLTACLRSLETQTCPPLETIVVVDHNPFLLERVRESFPRVRAVDNERSRGLAGARNAGIDLARGTWIAFIDDDAWAEPRWLERLLDGLSADPEVAGAGGALVPAWPGTEPRWLPHEFLWTVGCSYTGLPAKRAPVRNPIGANMVVRAEVLRQAGGFREGEDGERPRELRSRGVVRAAGNIPDDTDLAIRVSREKPDTSWLYQPDAVVHHVVTAERATLGYFMRRCYEEGVGKASLSRYVGSGDGLSSERRHLLSVLPRGVARNLGRLLRGDPGAGARAAAIVAGLAASAAGFLLTRLAGLAVGRGGAPSP